MPEPPAPRFQPCSGESWRDPFAMYRALRDRDPVHHVPDNGEARQSYTLESVVIDNYLFGVSSVATDGRESPVVFPGSIGAFDYAPPE